MGNRHAYYPVPGSPIIVIPLAVITAGAIFLMFSYSHALHTIHHRRVFVWYEQRGESLGSLRWRDATDGGTLSLGRVRDIWMGKRTPELTGPAAGSYPRRCCFSLVSDNASLHLVAPSEGVRKTWIQGLNDAYASHGIVVGQHRQ
jgi:hypothetical protein